jgi:hypothetical protein
MANTYLYKPGTTPLLSLNGTPLTGVTEVFFAIRTRPAQTVESGASASADVQVQLDYNDKQAVDLAPIIAQGGPTTAGFNNPLNALGISPNATGIHQPVRRHSAAQGDTVTVVIGAGTPTSYVVGVSTPSVADALGQQLVTENDGLVALRPAP